MASAARDETGKKRHGWCKCTATAMQYYKKI
jgi:hypothetical protein